MLRSFIAIETPTEIQAAITRSTAVLQAALPRPLVRWVAQANIHLTLKFLGDVTPVSLALLAEKLKTSVAACEPFTLRVTGLGAFPNPHRARVIWIGLEAPAALPALLRNIEAAAAQMGYAAEERLFSAHLTIGRAGDALPGTDLQRIRAGLEAANIGLLGAFPVEAVHIFKSDLQPGGPIYTSLYRLPMKTNNNIQYLRQNL